MPIEHNIITITIMKTLNFRRLWIVLAVCIISITASAQVEIIMEKDGGVYKVPCLVNGARMKFIFDTGASNVSLSLSMASYLYENDYISASDFVGTGSSQTADGSIVDHMTIILNDIEIGGLHLKNVEAIVLNSQTAPLLLGQSAIQKLGKIELDGNKLRIINANNDIDANSGAIRQLYIDAYDGMSKGLYSKACGAFEKLYTLGILSNEDKSDYAYALSNIDRYDEAYKVINDINLREVDKDDAASRIYDNMAFVCWGCERYSEAHTYFQLEFDASDSYARKAEIVSYMGNMRAYDGLYEMAVRDCQMALYCMELEYNLPQDYLWKDCCGNLKKNQKSYRNEDIDKWAFRIALYSYQADSWSFDSLISTAKLMGKLGNNEAIKYLNKRGISLY